MDKPTATVTLNQRQLRFAYALAAIGAVGWGTLLVQTARYALWEYQAMHFVVDETRQFHPAGTEAHGHWSHQMPGPQPSFNYPRAGRPAPCQPPCPPPCRRDSGYSNVRYSTYY